MITPDWGNRMSSTLPVPFTGKALVILIAFSCGIVAGVVWPVDSWIPLSGATGSIAVLYIFRDRRKNGNVAAIITSMLAGMTAVSVQISQQQAFTPPDSLINRMVSVSGTIAGTPRMHDGTTRFVLSCDSLYTQGNTYHSNGSLPCTILGRECVVFEGDRVALRGTLRADPRVVSDTSIIQPPSPFQTRYRLIATASADIPVVINGSQVLIDRIRHSLSDIIDRLPFGSQGGLVKAITMGDTRQLDPTVREAFAQAGIAHLLAVSGLHAGIVALAVLAVFRIAGTGRVLRFWGIMLCLVAYVALCGFRPPVMRAALMSSLVMGAGLMERRVRAEHLLATAALAILAIDPLALLGPSLQLSFAGVWTIVTFHPPVAAFFRERFRWYGPRHKLITGAVSLVLISALATIGTVTVAAAHFGMIPLLSVPVNVIAVPLIFPAVYLGALALLFAVTGPVFTPLAWIAAAGTEIILHGIAGIAGFVASLPYSHVNTDTFGSFTAVITMCWLFFLSRVKGRPPIQRALVYMPLVALLAVTWGPVLTPAMQRSSGHRIVFFDVGQGDAALVSTPDKRHFLIDIGTEIAAEQVVVPGLHSLGVIKLDGVFVSHMDDDHAGGLDAVLAALPVGRLFCRKDVADSLAERYAIEVTGIAAGDSVAVPDCGFAVLSPPEGGFPVRYGVTGENNASLVLRCDTGTIHAIFTGDIEVETQQALAVWGERLDGDVLKVPHHGAAPVNAGFFSQVAPEIAVISCGLNNRYRHPAPETVLLLEDTGAILFRTDIDGPVAIIGSHDGLAVQSLSP